MKTKTKKWTPARITALILAAVMILAFVISGVVSLFPLAEGASIKETEARIAELKKKQTEIAAQKKATQQALAGLNADVAGAMELLDAYGQQINLLNESIDNNTALLAELNLSIAERQLALEATIAEESAVKAQFTERLRSMDRMGQSSYLAVLLDAASLSDMMTRWDAIREVAEHDTQMAERLRTMRESIEAEQELLTADKAVLQSAREELAADSESLSELSREQQELVLAHFGDVIAYNLLLDEQDAMEDDIMQESLKAAEELTKLKEEEARRIAEEKARQAALAAAQKYVGGELLWPVPGYYNITSPFGMRLHPTYKVRRMHSGIDIGAPRNTEIVAANTGTIVTRAFSSSYGNYITIDHGGGIMTLYAHMNQFGEFKPGDTVAKGQVIGYVGTTGVSTGNHLHFEVWRDGKREDPEPWVKG